MPIRISGTIVSPTGTHKDHLITIDSDTRLITGVGAAHNQKGSISFSSDYLIFPGFVDVGVRGGERLNTLEEAAINGGVVAMALVPENPAPISEGAHATIEEGLLTTDLSIILYYRITNGSEPVLLHKRLDAPYLGNFTDEDAAEETLMHFYGSNVVVSQHDPLFPCYLEFQARYGFVLVISDVSKDGLELIHQKREAEERQAEEHGKAHGILCATTFGNCGPLIEGIRKEEVNFITTGYLKGSSGLESFGERLMELRKKHGLTPENICCIASLAPGAWISQFIPDDPLNGKGYGRIEPKYIASFAVINKHTGKVEHTIVRGQVMK